MNDIVEFERVYMIDEYNLIIKRMKIYGRHMNYCYLTYEVKQLFLCWFGDEENGERYFISVSMEMLGLQFWYNVEKNF